MIRNVKYAPLIKNGKNVFFERDISTFSCVGLPRVAGDESFHLMKLSYASILPQIGCTKGTVL